jgi:FixJ family two-component response regulator
MTRQPLVAIVDDDASIRETTQDLLESAGLDAATFASAEAFLDPGPPPGVSCVVADMRMPGMSGFALYQQLAASGHRLPTILITAFPDELVRARALQAGVVAYLQKPFTDDELLGWIGSALRKPTPDHSA